MASVIVNAVAGCGCGFGSSNDLGESDSLLGLCLGICLVLFGHGLEEVSAVCWRGGPESYLDFFVSSGHGLCHDPKLVLAAGYAADLWKEKH